MRRTVLALVFVLLALPLSAHADTTSTVPASLFPAGTDVTELAVVGNRYLDCNWNLDCSSGNPAFHTVTQETLGRTGGWGEELLYDKGDEQFLWLIFVSHYDSPVRAAAAAADFGTTAQGAGIAPLHAPSLGSASGAYAEQLDGLDLYALTVSVGPWEAEGMAIRLDPEHGDRPVARLPLVRSFRAIVSGLKASS